MHTVKRECKLRASRMGDDLVALKFEDDEGERLDPKELLTRMAAEAGLEPNAAVTIVLHGGRVAQKDKKEGACRWLVVEAPMQMKFPFKAQFYTTKADTAENAMQELSLADYDRSLFNIYRIDGRNGLVGQLTYGHKK